MYSRTLVVCTPESRMARTTPIDCWDAVVESPNRLSENDIKKACEVCIQAGAKFVKTGAGWTPSGAPLDVISLITSFVGDAIKVKASGGVRGLDTFVEIYKLDVARFGINVNASMSIIQECQALPGGAARV